MGTATARLISHDKDLLVTEVNGLRIDPPILLRRGIEVEITWAQERGPLPDTLDVHGYSLTPEHPQMPL
jgi:hypothetical protein